jgi:hypothetical protein
MRVKTALDYLSEQEKYAFVAAMEKTAAKFVSALRALMQRNPTAFNSYLQSQGVKPITPANYSDLSLFNAVQQLKHRRGPAQHSLPDNPSRAVKPVRPSKPAPWRKDIIVNSPSKTRQTLVKGMAKTSPPRLVGTGQTTRLSDMPQELGYADLRAFTGGAKINLSGSEARVTSLHGGKPAKNVYVTPNPTILGDYAGPYIRGPHGVQHVVDPKTGVIGYGLPAYQKPMLVGKFLTKNLKPAVTTTVKMPDGTRKTMPAYTHTIGSANKSVNTPVTLKIHERDLKRAPGVLNDSPKIDPQTGEQIGLPTRLSEAVMKDFKNVPADTLYRTVGAPTISHRSKAPLRLSDNAKTITDVEPFLDYTLETLKKVPSQDYQKYLNSLAKTYGVDTSKLEEPIKQLAAKQPITW